MRETTAAKDLKLGLRNSETQFASAPFYVCLLACVCVDLGIEVRHSMRTDAASQWRVVTDYGYTAKNSGCGAAECVMTTDIRRSKEIQSHSPTIDGNARGILLDNLLGITFI